MRVLIALKNPESKVSGSACILVLTTSKGVASPWLKDAHAPPATKYLGSIAVMELVDVKVVDDDIDDSDDGKLSDDDDNADADADADADACSTASAAGIAASVAAAAETETAIFVMNSLLFMLPTSEEVVSCWM
jgi:hypothetical protein